MRPRFGQIDLLLKLQQLFARKDIPTTIHVHFGCQNELLLNPQSAPVLVAKNVCHGIPIRRVVKVLQFYPFAEILKIVEDASFGLHVVVEPCANDFGARVDLMHELDLVALFDNVLLVDADGVVPDEARAVMVAEVVEGFSEVAADGE